jgi:hypothetical protein
MSVYLVSSHFYGYGCNRILGIGSSIDPEGVTARPKPRLGKDSAELW